jgi:hypothetical protein
LVFAVEQQADLAKRLDILFVRELHHASRI